MDTELLHEFDETVKLIETARAEVLARPYIEGQRGGAKASPWVIILRDAQAHLGRVARLLTARNQEVPVKDEALAALLDDE